MPFIEQLKMFTRFAFGLADFLKDPMTVKKSRDIIQQRLRDREKNLLSIFRRAIYENPQSPYLLLLNLAGCEYGDVEKMVFRDGVEQALSDLRKAGVYLTCDEFKGKQDVVRSGKTFRLRERDFDNPLLIRHFEGRTSASRSPGVRTIYDFDFLTIDFAAYLSQMMAGYHVMDLPLGIWFPIMPGAGPLVLLSYAKAGKTPDKWFSPVHANGFKPSLRNRAGTGYIVCVGSLLKAGFPWPKYVSVNNAKQIASWMSDMIKKRGGCWLSTYTSLAVQICHQARQHGIDISGAKFIGNGEPLTEAKRHEIQEVNADIFYRVLPRDSDLCLAA